MKRCVCVLPNGRNNSCVWRYTVLIVREAEPSVFLWWQNWRKPKLNTLHCKSGLTCIFEWAVLCSVRGLSKDRRAYGVSGMHKRETHTGPVSGGWVNWSEWGRCKWGLQENTKSFIWELKRLSRVGQEEFRIGRILLGKRSHECGFRYALLVPWVIFNHMVVLTPGCVERAIHPPVPEAVGGNLAWKIIHNKLYETFLVCILGTRWRVCNSCHFGFLWPQCIWVLVKGSVTIYSAAIHTSCSP